MARLVVENLTKVFAGPAGERIGAVAGAGLIVEDRELVVLVGPSGSGKTTMLRLIAGLEEADSGTVAIDGAVVNRVPPKDRDIAMVFQNYALYPHMSVYENLAFGLKLRKAVEIECRVQEASEMLGLVDFLDRRPEELSGGQRQRVALGRALVRQPKVLLLDEPLSGLDARLRAQMRREIGQLQRQLGLTVLYVTHDQMEAMSLGDRIGVMNEGVIQQVAKPDALYLAPCNRFVAEFFGTPPMNLFHGIIEGSGSGLFFRGQPPLQGPPPHEEAGQSLSQPPSGQDPAPDHRGFSVLLPNDRLAQMKAHLGKRIILGIRPEDIKISARPALLENEVEARTERIELLGPETNVHLAIEGCSYVARVPATNGLVLNEKVSLIFEMSRAHFFDAVTERRIDT